MCKSYNTCHDKDASGESAIHGGIYRAYHAEDKTKRKNGAQQCQERIIEPSMMNNKKSFFQSLREGFILYAAANTCFPVDAELMKLYRQTINEEMN